MVSPIKIRINDENLKLNFKVNLSTYKLLISSLILIK